MTQEPIPQNHNLIDIDTIASEQGRSQYNQRLTRDGIPQNYKISSPQRQEARDEINSILENDHFVENLNRKTLYKYTSDSDTDTDQEYRPRYRYPQKQQPQSPLRKKSPLPSPKNLRNTNKQTPLHTQQTHNENQTKQETKEQKYKYKITYNDDSLHCQGNGWKNEYMERDHRNPNATIKTTYQSNTITIDSNDPFNDLKAQLKTERNTEIQHNEIQTESTTMSSEHSPQNPLTSTLNDSLQQQDYNLPISPVPIYEDNQTPILLPINKTFQVQNESETNPYEQTNDTIYSNPTLEDDPEGIRIQNNPPSSLTDETLQQYDGNASATEINATTPEPTTATNHLYTTYHTIEHTNPKPKTTKKTQTKQETQTNTDSLQNDAESKMQTKRKTKIQPDDTKIPSKQPRQHTQEEQHTENKGLPNQNTITSQTREPTIPNELTNYNDPETSIKIVKRNKQIIRDLTNYERSESQQQQEQLRKQIEQAEQTLNNLNIQLAAEENNMSNLQATSPTMNTSSDEENDHTAP